MKTRDHGRHGAHGRKVFPCLQCVPWALLLFLFTATNLFAELKFPPPEFESGYKLPTQQNPIPRALLLQYADVLVLTAALGVATWAIYKKRSRKWVIGTGIFSLLYFGFYREGCVCAIGSIQNVSLGLFNSSYALPLGVIAFFALPLIVALFFGRTFCAAVCPHGALQDLVLLKPLKIPQWLEQGLGVIPFIYLGVAVLFAATGSAFVICEYDPFIPLFRLSGGTTALTIGASFLIAGVFIGRPYCRFFCPYGALLRISSFFSKWRVRITPDTCTQCTLCAESCPFGVIREPTPAPSSARILATTRTRFLWSLAALPLLIAFSAFAGNQFAHAAARMHPDVRLAEMHVKRQSGIDPARAPKDQIALTRAEQTSKELTARAETVQRRIQIGGWILGGWIGLVVGIKLLGVAAGKRRTEFEPERTDCFGCARCFPACPKQRLRDGLSPSQLPTPIAAPVGK
jgi:NosR/NirI family transcriptional regulator, nitrous oxide reductase regulator